jgi:SulP family sulfate permease
MTIKDIISGLITPIMIIATSLSYSVLIFSGPLAENLSIGAGFALIGAGLTAIVFAAGSGLPFTVAAPDSKAVAVMASLTTAIAADLAGQGRADHIGPTALVALLAGAMIVGVTSFISGALKLGRWIRFMPYPVIGGFMAASGWFLVSGALRIFAQEPLSLKLLGDIADGRHISKLAIGALIALTLHVAQRARHPLAFPAVLVACIVATVAGVFLAGLSPDAARAAGWLLNIQQSSLDLPLPWLFDHRSQIDPYAILRFSGQYVALIVVIVATLLLSIMALEVETKKDIDLDHELKLNGIANLVAGAAGGNVGTLSVSRTFFSYRMGARARGSGVMVGVLCLFPLALGSTALGYVPLPVLGAILLQLGATMLDEWLLRGWRRMQYADYLQLLAIFLTIVCFDFVAGVGVGIIAACITFAVNTSRIRLIKHGMNRSNFASRVDRPIYDTDTLVKFGEGIQILWLHGFIFFGTAHFLLQHIKDALGKNAGACKSLILDFGQVLGLDSSAVMTLIKLRHLSEQGQFKLVFSSLSPGVERSLRKGGLLEEGDDPFCRVFPDLDAALEWSEELLLHAAETPDARARTTEEWLNAELGDDGLFDAFMSYLTIRELTVGELIFAQGETGDSLYLLSSGRVTILLRTPEGKELRLRSMLGHTLLGEMGVYRGAPRGASVVVDQPTVVYQLTHAAIRRMETENPQLAHAFHKFVVRTLASRLDFANREVAALQR